MYFFLYSYLICTFINRFHPLYLIMLFMSYKKAQKHTLLPVLEAAWILLAVIDHSGIITLLPCTAP